MKTLIFVFLVFFLCGCNKKSDESVMLERCQQQVSDLTSAMAFKLSSMYDEVASCALLAKCVGAQVGEVEPIELRSDRDSVVGGSINLFADASYRCVLKKNLGLKASTVERVGLDKVKPMLDGCIRGK